MDRAREILSEARHHKRQSEFHRRRAQEGMQQLADFCRRHGIQLEVIQAEGKEFHGQSHQHTR